jgi:hypothetical protein
MKDIPELTEQDFSRALTRKQRKRLMDGLFETGGDIVALRGFVGLSQTRLQKRSASACIRSAIGSRGAASPRAPRSPCFESLRASTEPRA